MKLRGLACCIFLTSVCLGSDYTSPKLGDPLRSEVLDALRPTVEKEIGQEVMFKIDQLRVSSRFAFITAQPLTKLQESIDYSKTKFSDDVREGIFDDWLCALLEKGNGKWNVVALEIGATDVPYITWPAAFGVPKEIIFGDQ